MRAPSHDSPPQQPLKSFDYGIWRVVYEHSVCKPTSWIQDAWSYVRAVRDAPIVRFFKDIYAVDSKNFVICLLSRCIKGLEQSILMYLSARLLTLVS